MGDKKPMGGMLLFLVLGIFLLLNAIAILGLYFLFGR